ncbi:hypothetical protein LQW54_001789 [Pestalotiopsis sp. IQ-011]
MKAYYKIAKKKFLDSITVEVVEILLMAALPAMLSPLKVFEMPPELIAQLAGEPERVQCERKELERRLAVLNKGYEIFRQFLAPDANAEPAAAGEGGKEDVNTRRRKHSSSSTLTSGNDSANSPNRHAIRIPDPI